MKLERVEFHKRVPRPRGQHIEGAHIAEGFTITRNGDDVVLYHADFGATVLVVPWSNCAAAFVAEEEMTRPEAKKK